MCSYADLMPDFYLLTFALFSYILVIVYYKLFRAPIGVFLFLIVTELFSPAAYYIIFEGDIYTNFSVNALRLYIELGTVAFFSYAMILWWSETLILPEVRIRIPNRWNVFRCFVKKFEWVIVFVILGYLSCFYDRLPVWQAIVYGIKISRPDTTGAIPHWFTMSNVLYFILPTFFFFHFEKKDFSEFTNIVCLLLLSVGLTLGGNKGFLVYFILFVWIYCYEMKGICVILVGGCFSVAISAIIMYGSVDGLLNGFMSTFQYGIRRTFITQGAMFVNYIELLLNDFFFSYTDMTSQVLNFVCGTPKGSAPTYYLGSLCVYFGFGWGFLLHMLVFVIFTVINRYMSYHKVGVSFIWCFFCVQYLLGMSGIEVSLLYRVVMICASGIMIILLKEENYQRGRKVCFG